MPAINFSSRPSASSSRSLFFSLSTGFTDLWTYRFFLLLPFHPMDLTEVERSPTSSQPRILLFPTASYLHSLELRVIRSRLLPPLFFFFFIFFFFFFIVTRFPQPTTSRTSGYISRRFYPYYGTIIASTTRAVFPPRETFFVETTRYALGVQLYPGG